MEVEILAALELGPVAEKRKMKRNRALVVYAPRGRPDEMLNSCMHGFGAFYFTYLLRLWVSDANVAV